MLKLPIYFENCSKFFIKRKYSNFVTENKFVLGCGSNVVDRIFKVQAVPKSGEKGFFQSPTKTLEKSVVGGVTLNHLSWASLLKVPTGLLALQGDDAAGNLIRQTLKQLKVNPNFIKVDNGYTSAESYVFVQQDGERSIVMASGATSLISDQAVSKYFESAVLNDACMLTTEISQVPLSGVIQLLTLAKQAGVLTIVDFDVSPSVAFNEAKLGNLDQLKRIIGLADILKPAKHAAQELLTLLRPDIKKTLSPSDITKYLQELSNAKLIAMTNGSKSMYMATDNCVVEIPTTKLVDIVDATGAGDAFLGGVIAGIYHDGLPTTEDEIRKLGELANKTGAASCLVLGGLPESSSRDFLMAEVESFNEIPTRIEAAEKEAFDKNVEADSSILSFRQSLTSNYTALKDILTNIDPLSVSNFINTVSSCTGNVFTTGIGKSGIVASRMAASFSSISIPAQFIHATEWAHGDLGKIRSNDIVVIFSHSGETDEIIHAVKLIEGKCIPILAIVGCEDSSLAKMCVNKSIWYGSKITEALDCIPTTSLILQEAVVNAILCELVHRLKLTKKQFLVNHPGGSLGKMLC